MDLQATPEVKAPVLGREDELVALRQQVAQLEYQLLKWQRLAVWLAYCHAVVLECLPKYTPRYLRDKVASVCQKFVLGSVGAFRPPLTGNTPDDEVLDTVARCHQAIKECGTLRKERKNG
jgi:hypothetical protein